MIEISNLRISIGNEWTTLIADIQSDFKRSDQENTIWIAVKNEDAYMLNDETYDAFLCMPVFMAMYYKSDLRIRGNVSKPLYHNVVKYVESVLDYFKEGMQKINIIVDGFAEVQTVGDKIGTGISCGVDCLQTIYDNYMVETDSDYKINSLFNFNCGWHGDFYDEKTRLLFIDRSMRNKRAADDMKLSFHLVDSNLHAFLPQLGDQASYFSLYTCAFALEKGLRKYYISSSYSYRSVSQIGYQSRNRDFSEFGDPFVIPLLHSEKLELLLDGGQYERSEKTERIADWDISKNHLNVCCANINEGNCSVCHKCVRTLLALDALGKLDEYGEVFDIEKYRKIAHRSKCRIVLASRRKVDIFSKDIVSLYKKKNKPLPSWIAARLYIFRLIIKKKLIGKEI